MTRTIMLISACLLWAAAAGAADGAAIYAKRCKTCHSIAGKGGPMAKMGGALDGIGAKHDEGWLTDYLKNPKSKVPNAKMPALRLDAKEWDAVIGYLMSLK